MLIYEGSSCGVEEFRSCSSGRKLFNFYNFILSHCDQSEPEFRLRSPRRCWATLPEDPPCRSVSIAAIEVQRGIIKRLPDALL